MFLSFRTAQVREEMDVKSKGMNGMIPSFRQEKYYKARFSRLSILAINLSLTRNYYRDVYKGKISSHVFYLLRFRYSDWF